MRPLLSISLALLVLLSSTGWTSYAHSCAREGKRWVSLFQPPSHHCEQEADEEPTCCRHGQANACKAGSQPTGGCCSDEVLYQDLDLDYVGSFQESSGHVQGQYIVPRPSIVRFTGGRQFMTKVLAKSPPGLPPPCSGWFKRILHQSFRC